jgi:hypothetical protein
MKLLAVFDFLVGHAVKLVGQRAQAFGDQADAGGVNRQLAGFGFEQRAGGGHDVAQVPVLEGLMDVFADTFVVDVDLDAPARRAEGRVLQGRKAGLAHHALEHHAAGHADSQGQRLQLFLGFSVIRGKQRAGAVRRFDVVGEGHAPPLGLLLAQRLEFFAALGHQLVLVLRWCCRSRGSRRVVGHEGRFSKKIAACRGRRMDAAAGKTVKSTKALILGFYRGVLSGRPI